MASAIITIGTIRINKANDDAIMSNDRFAIKKLDLFFKMSEDRGANSIILDVSTRWLMSGMVFYVRVNVRNLYVIGAISV